MPASVKNITLLCLLGFCLFTAKTRAQCQASFNGILCAGNPIVFSNTGTAGQSYSWNFSGEGSSAQAVPAFTFSLPGSKNVTLTVKYANGQSCTSTITFYVNPKPVEKLRLVNEQVQCVENNIFCFTDSSTSYPNNCFKRIKYLFDDGELIEVNNPVMPYKFCKSYTGSGAGLYGVTVELEDCNGCISKFKSQTKVILADSGIADFNITDSAGCDSLNTSFVNTSPVDFNEVKKFYWDFGDGTTDSVHWGLPEVKHTYTREGYYDVKLFIKTKDGCTQRITRSSVARVGRLKASIWVSKDSFCIADPFVDVKLTGQNISSVKRITWNFGDLASGSDNIVKNINETSHKYINPGPYRISLTVADFNCPDTVMYDTVVILGPLTIIEKPGNFIRENEKYQCVSRDTVHFPNFSLFYHNDPRMSNDDSVYLQNGELEHNFDNTGQSVKSKPQIRGYENVERLWFFDDPLAEACTTDTKKGININRNCNYSRDSLPRHYYTPWDTVYYKLYYKSNYQFQNTVFDPFTASCTTQSIDTTQKEAHRAAFYRTIPRCYRPRLSHRDTVHPMRCEMETYTLISIMPPSATNLRIGSTQCIGPYVDTFGISFFLEDTKPGCSQNTLYICPDSITNPNRWLSMTAGLGKGPLPAFSVEKPYSINGTYGNVFSYKYAKSDITDPDGRVTIGLIIGNGTGSNSCFDTVWYHHMTRFPVVHDTLEVLKPKDDDAMCKGDTIIFTMPEDNGNKISDISQLTWMINNLGPLGPDLKSSVSYRITETYLRNYPDKDRAGKIADYLAREKIWQTNGKIQKTAGDTIKISESDSVQRLMQTSNPDFIIEALFAAKGFDLSKLTPEEATALLWNGKGIIGDPSSGARGCIDTVMNGHRIDFFYKSITRRTLHFRDTSLVPYDDLQRGTQLQQHVYHYIPKYNGQYLVNLVLQTTKGCVYDDGLYKIISVGFYADPNLSDSVFCKNKEIRLKPNFRYFDRTGQNALDTNNYWYRRMANAGKPGYEGITRWDWSRDDDKVSDPATIYGPHPYGYTGLDNNGVLLGGTDPGKIYYKDGGIYRFRITTADSNGCRDTVERRLYVNQVKAKFNLNANYQQCKTIVSLKDSSFYTDFCKQVSGYSCNSIKYWRIDWGDSTATNQYFGKLPNNIGHDYTRFGKFRIWLWATTEAVLTKPPTLFAGWKDGCTDSFYIDLDIPGPKPRFIPDRYFICAGDSILFRNTTQLATSSARWIWNFGDNVYATDTGKNNVQHTYYKPGTYKVFISQYDSIPGTVKYCDAIYPDIPLDTAIIINVKATDLSDLTADKYKICPGDMVQFTADAPAGYTAFRWQFGKTNDTLRTLTKTTSKQFNDRGTYTVYLEPVPGSSISKPYCFSGDSVNITVDTVKAEFNIFSTDTPVFCFNNLSGNAVSYRWGFYHKNNIVFSKKPLLEDLATGDMAAFCRDYLDSMGHFWVCLEATNETGCKDTVCHDLNWFRDRLILPPNIFTPGTVYQGAADDEGVYTDNDVFNIYIKGHDKYDLKIYDRWGVQVFESKDHLYDWNGRINNTGAECPDGTYYYLLNYRYKGRKKDEPILNGVVTLIREK